MAARLELHALALGAVGKLGEAQSWLDYVSMISARANSTDLQIMYGIDGEADLPEMDLAHVEGYRGSAPVRIGNGAAKQRQLDTYGELCDSIWLLRRRTQTPLSPHRERAPSYGCGLFPDGVLKQSSKRRLEPRSGL